MSANDFVISRSTNDDAYGVCRAGSRASQAAFRRFFRQEEQLGEVRSRFQLTGTDFP
jgi:hypothetical protein